MLEPAPDVKNEKLSNALNLLNDHTHDALFRKIENKYLYWDKVKYLAPEGVSPVSLWQAVKLTRTLRMKSLSFGRHEFRYTLTDRMLALLHQFDLNFGGSLGAEGSLSTNDKKYILNSSVMEEAIASSQMEGANTTRKVAKEMLRRQSAPKDKSERMIVNNYNTIRFISEISGEDFSVDLILRIHKMISNATLDDIENEGRLRENNDIYVMNSINGEIAHTPPSFDEIREMLEDLCSFANDGNEDEFTHPIIKGIIIHFVLAYIHPFCDGNGRTARSLVYWFLLKNGYSLAEYLSISRIIYRTKPRYEKSFLCVESDGLDMTYFILYHLEVIEEAFNELKEYLDKKIREKSSLESLASIPGLTLRQAEILTIFNENPGAILSAKEIANKYGLSAKAIRNDLRALTARGLVAEIPVNGREYAYTRPQEP